LSKQQDNNGHRHWTYEQELLEYIEGSDFLLIESNHDIEMLKVGPYRGPEEENTGDKGICPMKWQASGGASCGEGTRCFMLGHLSKENNFPELAYETVRNILKERNIDIERI